MNQNYFSKLKRTGNILADLYSNQKALISRTDNEFWELLSVENNGNCRYLLLITNL